MKRVLNILEHVRNACTSVLGDVLTGVYVHGSIAFGCFTWERSDIDLLIVVHRPLQLHEKTALLSALLANENEYPAKGLEMSVVLESDCRSFRHPMHYELHYSNAYREAYQRDAAAYCERMQGGDRDLAAHCTVIRHAGQVLHGKPIDAVFGDVPVADYLDSLHYDIDAARNDILDNPMYIILNLCRVAAYLQDGVVLSKQQGGEWGLSRLHPKWAELLKAALADYAGEEISYGVHDLAGFADEMCAFIDAYTKYYA